MNKLWIFGDSFSSLIDFENLQNDNIKNYLSQKNLRNYKTWSELLSEKIDFSLTNHAMGGKSNYQIFFDVCDNINHISSNDIVIIGWALIEKFMVVDNNTFNDIHPNGEYHHLPISNNSIKEIIKNRQNKTWVNEIEKWKKLISFTSLCRNFRVIYWSGEEELLKNNMINLSECSTIQNETNNEIIDTHLGAYGHNKLADFFYNYIKNE